MLRIEKLHRDHYLSGFDCGIEELNRFLIKYALTNQQARDSTTYLALADKEVVGYYTLASGSVKFEDAPERLQKGVARHPVPIVLLARLAVSVMWQGRRIGSGFLKEAMKTTLEAARIIGVRALVAHAKDDHARAFYQHHDFVESPIDSYQMILPVKDISKNLGSAP
jgi:predicted N-acetyltransferase YhbS